jgi:phosphatidylethanolamine N-methyltransferase
VVTNSKRYWCSYIGFYGISLITRSYTVLYVSLAAHLCQFLFLGYVENPRTALVVGLQPARPAP